MKKYSSALGILFLIGGLVFSAPASSHAENGTTASPATGKNGTIVHKNGTSQAPSANATSAKEIKVVIADNHFELELYGIHATASMQDIHNIAAELWKKFTPLVPANEQAVYGVSVTTDAKSEKFEYWAAATFDKNKPIPSGLEKVVVPAGTYAKIYLASYDDLSSAYNYLFNTWAKSQNEYKLNLQGTCIERYNDFKNHGKKVELLCGVEKTGVAPEKSANASANISGNASKPVENASKANATKPEPAEKPKAKEQPKK